MQFNIPFSEISEHGSEYKIQETSWIPDEIVDLAGPVDIRIRLTKKNDTQVEIKGSLKTSVYLKCDRCLKQYVYDIDSPMQMVAKVLGTDEHWKLQGMEKTSAELEIIGLERPVVELGEIFREQLLLALPYKKLCAEDCAGFCPNCGADLNEKQCDCNKQPKNNPFAVLGNLKKK